MSRFEELLERLNEKEIRQVDCSWYENIPDDIWQEYFTDSNYTVLKSDIDVDKHRWLERSTVAIGIEGHILGINLVTQIYSESNDIDDIYSILLFFEMEAIKSVTYKKKK